jgi:peptidoglycan/LPS O-acetylase OafA/YrhL
MSALTEEASSPAGALEHRVRPLDGLRAVAVAVVLLYHGEIPWARGGFLGISLFFTLSGFLITSMLLRTHHRVGSIDLRTFWARRYRRLLPAAYVTLAGVLVFGATVATEQQVADLPGAIAASLAQVTNWFFIVTGQSYVALFTAPSPVQHFWSLAIEEQFYLVMPLALIALLRATRSLRVVAAVLAAAAVASTVTMVTLFERGASLDRLYYGTDTRAAELLVGALLAVLLHARPLPADGRLRRALPLLGLACAAVLAWGFTQATLTDAFLYRGGFLVFACASAGLIVSVLGGRGPLATGLAVRPLVALGLVSYAVYLFHWPLFLWLTPARTGLGLWPLFGLRVAVTIALAVVSYFAIEMPVRRGAWRGISRSVRWAIPVGAATLLLAGAATVGQRDVNTELAGLGDAAATVPLVAARGDGVLDVLVITDAAGAPVGPALRAAAATTDDLRVSIAPEFTCSGVEGKAPTACTNWLADWPELVAAEDPDVVLFHVTQWVPDEIARLSRSSDPGTQTAWTRATMGAGFDLLSAKGATIVWSQDPVADMAAALRREREPFYAALQAITSERTDTYRRDVIGQATGPLLTDLREHRRIPADDKPVLMVVGDSVARTMGFGLERWAADRPDVRVWSAAIEGCGIADEGETPDAAGRLAAIKAQCRGRIDALADAVEQLRPRVVVVFSSVFDLQDRRLPGSDRVLAPGDRRFDDYLVDEYVDAVDTLSASGAKVVWVKNPCVRYALGTAPVRGSFDTERIRYVNDVILERVVQERPDIRFFDMFRVLCPRGEFVEGADDVDVLRTDGVHFSPEGSRWFAQKYGQRLLDLGLG